MRKQSVTAALAALLLAVIVQSAVAQSMPKWMPKFGSASQPAEQPPAKTTVTDSPPAPVPEPVEARPSNSSEYVVPYAEGGNSVRYDASETGEPMSQWPGVPACCDPWLGYCNEPRCYPCAKGKGHYTYYEPGRDGCGGRFITYGPDCKTPKSAGSNYRFLGWGGGSNNSGSTNGCVTCSTCQRLPPCDTCSVSGGPSEWSPLPYGAPPVPAEAAPPRNELPSQPADVTARRLRH